jgi:hypothetical protein
LIKEKNPNREGSSFIRLNFLKELLDKSEQYRNWLKEQTQAREKETQIGSNQLFKPVFDRIDTYNKLLDETKKGHRMIFVLHNNEQQVLEVMSKIGKKLTDAATRAQVIIVFPESILNAMEEFRKSYDGEKKLILYKTTEPLIKDMVVCARIPNYFLIASWISDKGGAYTTSGTISDTMYDHFIDTLCDKLKRGKAEPFDFSKEPKLPKEDPLAKLTEERLPKHVSQAAGRLAQMKKLAKLTEERLPKHDELEAKSS